MIAIDLHIHSVYSDGTDGIEQIMQKAKEKKLDLIAISDHNTLANLDDLKVFSKKYNQKVLAGIEVSTMYQGKEIHILGYFPVDDDFQTEKFHDLYQFLDEYKQTKVIQNNAMIMKLKEKYSCISLDEFYQYTNSQNINRVHIAKYLIYKGIVKDINTAFDQYIGSHCPYYVKRKEMSIQKGIEAIKKANGIAIIAHLGEYHLNDKEINELIDVCICYGIDGFECYHPLNDKKTVKMIQNYQQMILTAGSDYHGLNKKDNEMGISYHYLMSEKECQQYHQTITKTYDYFKKWVKK